MQSGKSKGSKNYQLFPKSSKNSHSRDVDWNRDSSSNTVSYLNLRTDLDHTPIGFEYESDTSSPNSSQVKSFSVLVAIVATVGLFLV